MVALINTALLRTTTALAGLRARLAEERGQDLLEYALLGGLVAIGLIAAVTLFSGAFVTFFGGLQTWVAGLPPA
jgi:Flp pilus assembly pilin Flp